MSSVNRNYQESVLNERTQHYWENKDELHPESFNPGRLLNQLRIKFAGEDVVNGIAENSADSWYVEWQRFCLGAKVSFYIFSRPFLWSWIVVNSFGLFTFVVVILSLTISIYFMFYLGFWAVVVIALLFVLLAGYYSYYRGRWDRAATHAGLVSNAPGAMSKEIPFMLWYNFLSKVFVIKATGISLTQLNNQDTLARLSTSLLWGHRVKEVVSVPRSSSIFKVICVKKLPRKLDFTEDIIKAAPKEVSIFCGYSGQYEFIPLEGLQMMTSGMTNSGKSVALSTVLTVLLCRYHEEIELHLMDLKGGLELQFYQDFYPVKSMIYEISEAVEALKNIYSDMVLRNEILRKAKVKNLTQYNKKVPKHKRLKRVIIWVDEFAELMTLCKKYDKESKKKGEETTSELVESISRVGRALGYHLSIALQKPTSALIGTQLKGQLGLRITGKMPDNASSIVAVDCGAAFSRIENIPGRFLYRYGTRLIEVQYPYLSEEDSLRFIKKYLKGFDTKLKAEPSILKAEKSLAKAETTFRRTPAVSIASEAVRRKDPETLVNHVSISDDWGKEW